MVRSVSGHVKNSFREERVGHQQLEVRHGILHSPFLHHDLGHVQRGKRCVESAVEFVRLLMTHVSASVPMGMDVEIVSLS